MYENITNDITTTTTKLVIVPTPIAKNDSASDNVTSPNVDSKEQNYQLVKNTSNIVVPQEEDSRKKENASYKDGRK